MKIGDFFVSTWGYEQTNVSFYQITKITTKCVYLQEYWDKRTAGDTWGHYTAVPNIEKPIGAPFRRKFTVDNNGRASVNIGSCQWAREWDNKPVHGTNYA